MANPVSVISDRWILIGLLILALPGVLFIGLGIYSWFRSSSSSTRGDDDSMQDS
ncbi:MAG TPA: hypothetical protein VFW23_03990 [Tepidisphaeraceae bacterium]|nr:hypothetical protein [Tepidisphaeraceae bacterium]